MASTLEILNQRLGGMRNKSAEWVQFKCPFCVGTRTGTRRSTFGVNFRKGKYGCVRCGEHGGIKGLFEELGLSFTQSVERNKCITHVRASGVKLRIPNYQRFSTEKPKANVFGVNVAWEYAVKRNFINVNIDCGYTPIHPYYVIFPVKDDCSLTTFYQGRLSINDERMPKTVNPRIPKEIIYRPYGASTENLVLVEGIADGISVGYESGVILGKRLNLQQLRTLDRIVCSGNVKRITTFLDGDAITDAVKMASMLYFRYLGDIDIYNVDWSIVGGYEEMDPNTAPDPRMLINRSRRVKISGMVA